MLLKKKKMPIMMTMLPNTQTSGKIGDDGEEVDDDGDDDDTKEEDKDDDDDEEEDADNDDDAM